MTCGKRNQKYGNNFVIFAGRDILCNKLSGEKNACIFDKNRVKNSILQSEREVGTVIAIYLGQIKPIPFRIGNGKT